MPRQSSQAQPLKIHSLQILRAVAAISVVLFHTQSLLLYEGRPITSNQLGEEGVDLFFVISGFIILFVSWDQFQQPAASGQFLKRRAFRIIPVYWIFTTAMMLAIWVAPKGWINTTFEWFDIPNSYFFLGAKPPIDVAGWTLTFELYFYLVFGMLLAFPRRYVLILLGAIFAACITAGAIMGPTQPWARTFIDPILLEFYAGCIVSALVRKGLHPTTKVSIALVAYGVLQLVITAFFNLVGTVFGFEVDRAVMWGIPSAALVFGVIGLERASRTARLAFIEALGDASFSIYLIQVFTLPLVGKLWMLSQASKEFGPKVSILVLSTIGTIVTIGAGYAAYLAIERPMLRTLLGKRPANTFVSKPHLLAARHK